ncbi:hypothetical protein VTN77DRAFT_5451 [Rasamsonia byssochlamydoides]|uniref:uncharacterized protein n=1 Tax=Rasamsonia byssochlamydoides TaxID=89139 RepID=UPI00374409C7
MSSKPKRTSARSAKKDPWGEEFLTTNPKSPLVKVDLVKLFANPKAWTCLDESEKKEILALLPEHVHPNPDPDPEDPNAKIPPLPQEFLRYDNNWRYGVRQFQVDLEAGRYDPEWLRQAAQAMKERAEGKFDKFKEEEFEQFWGQKQKLDYHLIAGESSKVKLDTLIKHGVVRVGDVWKYSRVFGKEKTGRIFVEKEAKILAIDGSTLTFAVPAGQRVFLSNTYDTIQGNNIPKKEVSNEDVSKNETEMRSKSEIETNEGVKPSASTEVNGLNNEVQAPVDRDGDHRVVDLEPKPENKDGVEVAIQESVPEASSNASVPEMKTEVKKRGRGRPRKRKASDQAPGNITVEPVSTASSEVAPSALETVTNPVSHSKDEGDVQVVEGNAPEPNNEHSTSSIVVPSTTLEPSGPYSTSAAPPPEKKQEEGVVPRDIILPNVAGPGALANKILEIDGRIKDPPNGNAWKEFRCYRNNQDMGSLWEVRQAWYVREKR